MSSRQIPSNAGHPGQPGPDFAIPPEGGYSDQNPPPPPPSIMYSTSYPEDPTREESREIMKKFYSLFMSLLLLMFGIYSFVVVHEPTKLFITTNHQWLLAAGIGTMTVSFIGSVTCFLSGRRESPMIWIFQLIGTGAYGISLQSSIIAKQPEHELLPVYGFGITSILFFALTLFAFWMKLDLTRLHTVLFACAIGLLIFGIVIIYLPSYVDFFIFCPLGAILLSFYFIYDTPTYMNYPHKYSISEVLNITKRE